MPAERRDWMLETFTMTPPDPLALHVHGGPARQVCGHGQVDADRPLPGLDRERAHRGDLAPRGVVDEDVEAAEALGRPRHDRFGEREVREVAGHGQGLAAGRAHAGGGLVEARFPASRHRHVVAAAGELQRGRGADAARGARDEHNRFRVHACVIIGAHEDRRHANWIVEPGARVEGDRPLDQSKVQAPGVVALPGGGYRLFYTGVGPGRPYPEAQGYILSAVSDDGLEFRKEPGIRVGPDPSVPNRSRRTLAPTVTHLPDGRWRMYFESRGPADRPTVICSAVSTDLLDWEIEDGIRLEGMQDVGGPRYLSSAGRARPAPRVRPGEPGHRQCRDPRRACVRVGAGTAAAGRPDRTRVVGHHRGRGPGAGRAGPAVGHGVLGVAGRAARHGRAAPPELRSEPQRRRLRGGLDRGRHGRLPLADLRGDLDRRAELGSAQA